MGNLSRREFVIAAAACAGCVMCGIDGASTASAAEAKPVDAGPLSAYPKDGIYDQHAKQGFLIIRREGKLYAPTSTCSHKGSTVKAQGNEILCAKHGSRFDLDGKPIKKPAKLPLVRYGIRKDDAGHLIVDKSRTFDSDKWNDPDASVPA